jgi:hypothetical protein
LNFNIHNTRVVDVARGLPKFHTHAAPRPGDAFSRHEEAEVRTTRIARLVPLPMQGLSRGISRDLPRISDRAGSGNGSVARS